MRIHCTITLETLLDLRDGRVPPQEEARLRGHMAAACTRCADNWRWLGEVLPDMPSAVAEAGPSAAATAYVRSLARLLQTAPPVTGWRRQVARVWIGGSPMLGGPPAAIVAGARGTGSPMQRLFETDDHWVTLWDEPDTAMNRYLIGQIYRRDGGAVVVPQSATLALPDASERIAAQEGGEFHLASVPPGIYLITCVLPAGDELLIPGVRVGVTSRPS